MVNNKKIVQYIISTLTIFILVGCNKAEAVNTSKEKVMEKVELTVSAAASLKDVMSEISSLYKINHPHTTLTFNFGASGSLQQQIEQGAPVDIFISAAKKQISDLESKKFIVENTNKELLRNSMVLIAAMDTEIRNIDQLKSEAVKFIALGEPTSVPAGKYADETLNNLNIKSALSSKLVFAKDVKEVLAWVISKNADVGFVYYSDTINNKDIKIIEPIADYYHSPIIYPVAIINSTKNLSAAKEFEDYLFSKEATAVFEKYGYKSAK